MNLLSDEEIAECVLQNMSDTHSAVRAIESAILAKLADDLDAEFAQGRISNHNGRKAAAEIRLLLDRLEIAICAAGQS